MLVFNTLQVRAQNIIFVFFWGSFFLFFFEKTKTVEHNFFFQGLFFVLGGYFQLSMHSVPQHAMQCICNLPSLVHGIPIQSCFHTFIVLSLETGCFFLVETIDVPVFLSEGELEGTFEISLMVDTDFVLVESESAESWYWFQHSPCFDQTCELPYRNPQPAG